MPGGPAFHNVFSSGPCSEWLLINRTPRKGPAGQGRILTHEGQPKELLGWGQRSSGETLEPSVMTSANPMGSLKFLAIPRAGPPGEKEWPSARSAETSALSSVILVVGRDGFLSARTAPSLPVPSSVLVLSNWVRLKSSESIGSRPSPSDCCCATSVFPSEQCT